MQWTAGEGAGFTTGRPWLRVAPDATERNVAGQADDADSVLAAYRRLLTYRRTAPALRRGGMARLESGSPDVLAWTRTGDDQRVLVVVNFVGEPRRIDVGALDGGGWAARIGSHREPATVGPDGVLELRADEAVILEVGQA